MRKITRREALLVAAGLGGAGAVIAALNGSFARLMHAIQVALQPPPMPEIVLRQAWGAAAPNHDAIDESGVTDDPTDTGWYVYSRPLSEVYNTAVIHHSATRLFANETMAGLQRLHMDVNHWADVGYHYAIDKHGVIYEGRDIHVRGASVAGHNTGVIGIVVMGDFEQDQPFEVQLEKLQVLLNWLTNTYSLTHLAGHHEFNPETVCPGKNLAVYLDQLAEQAGLQRGTEGYVPPTA